MAKELCFLCGQPFERGHKCANKERQLFLIEVFGEYEEDPVITETFDGELEFVPEKTSSQISINAMNKNFGFQAMRFNGHLEKKTRHILIDLGSTFNFLDE